MNVQMIACRALKEDLRSYCSSGGFYPVLANEILQRGGVVFAACYMQDLEVAHCKVVDEEGIYRSCGSKYIESRLGDTYRQVKEQLMRGVPVLFVGTPCQCAGLKSFVGESDLLLCADFVCHGIPGRVAWRAYLNGLKKQRHALKRVNMRCKNDGWSRMRYSWKLEDELGRVCIQPAKSNMYMRAYLRNICLRPSCYECKFRGENRFSDFTLADYWGVWDLQPEMDDDKGTSLVWIRTKKGLQWFKDISDHFYWAHADSGALKYNAAYNKSPQKPVSRAFFYEMLQAPNSFETAVIRSLGDSFLFKIKNMVKKVVHPWKDGTGGEMNFVR